MNNRSPKGRPSSEKPKNFKDSIKRLLRELSGYRAIIIFALILAIAGSILSILAPNQLSKLTDEISGGLVVDRYNLEEITETTTAKLNNENITSILNFDLSQSTITRIMADSSISNSDKLLLSDILSNASDDSFISKLGGLPDSVLSMILPSSTYENVLISSTDKILFIKAIASSDMNSMPDSISGLLFPAVTVDDTLISTSDQLKFLSILSTMGEDTSVNVLYSKIDEMPESVRDIVEPKMDMDGIRNIALLLVGFYICSALFTYIESISMTNVANKFAKKLRDKISKKINRLPLKYFDSHETGDVLSRVTNDVDTIAQSMNQSLATLVSSITLIVGSMIMMFVTNWILALTAILASVIGFVFMFIVLGKSQKHFVARQVELGNLNGHIEEVYSGLNVVKAYNGKKECDKEFDRLNDKVYEANRKSQFLSGLMMPMMNFIGNLGYVAVCIVGALLAVDGTITFGVIIAFITYVRLFTSPLSQFAQAMTSLQSTAAASERVFEFVDEKEMSKEKVKNVLDRDKVKGNITFSHVSFTYDGNDKPTINDFSAKALSGQKVAIVGPTGAGKTTMVNLLMRFYEITSGDILIDGVSTKDLSRENIHELFTMVLQDTWLFNGTIMENIVYNKKDISKEQVKEVCKTIGLDHFIKTLPHGYDSVISDNDSVSAGQRQLLTIARGMIHNAPLLILDEATSNVDTRTEELVQNAMDKLTYGKTSFIIAHRLSTIKNADLILVMKDGNIIEQGNHKELLKKNGFYAELYNSQFEE